MTHAKVAVAERRRSERHDVTWPMWLWRSNGMQTQAVCLDLSDGGLAFRTDIVLKVGEIIDAYIPEAVSDAQEPRRELRARVTYRYQDRYGAALLSEAKLEERRR